MTLHFIQVSIRNIDPIRALWWQCFFPSRFSTLPFVLCGPSSVVGIATGYKLDGSGIESRWGARFSAPVQTSPGAHPASCTMGTASFLGVKRGRGVTLTPHPLLVPWSWKGRAIPVLPLWDVRPVQSLSACTRVHFNFTYFRTLLLCCPASYFLINTAFFDVTPCSLIKIYRACWLHLSHLVIYTPVYVFIRCFIRFLPLLHYSDSFRCLSYPLPAFCIAVTLGYIVFYYL